MLIQYMFVFVRGQQYLIQFILFFQIESGDIMGQTTFNCETKPTTPRDLFSQELNIYQWRANPNNNNFVSRVTFKNAYTQKQEQKFAEFLRQQQQENYLEIYKFKEESQDLKKFRNQDVIVFEKYACTLKELTGKLKIQDALYTLHGLLFGFEELRKIYEKVVVEDSCCFVTNEGEVRVWINPNPKSNQVWTGLQEQLISQTNIRNILTKIVNLGQKIAIRNYKSDQFFNIMHNMLSKSTFKHCYYADLRRVINEFCYLNNIQMSKNLLNILKSKQSIMEVRKSYKREQRNTQASNVREKMVYLPTSQSQTNLQQKSLLLKSKSLQNHAPLLANPPNIQKRQPHPHNIQNGSQITYFQPNSHILPTMSHIYQVRPHQTVNSSSITTMQRNSHLNQRNTIQQSKNNTFTKLNKESTHICSQDIRKSGFLQNKIVQVQSCKSSNSKQVMNSQHLIENNNANNLSKKTSKLDKSKKVREPIKQMQVSIVQNIKNENNAPSFVRQETHHKTCMDRHSLQQSSQSGQNWSRPWITTKTLTRLISDNDIQLKNSIAQSSDYYNQSVYSGALTHLGRDITPPNADRSKTVRVSRQI